MEYNQAEAQANSNGGNTVAAIVVGTILVVPCYLLGAIAVIIYSFFKAIGTARYDGGSWIPFVDGLFHVLWSFVVPGAIAGGVTVFAALFVTKRIFKSADSGKLAYTVCGIWAALLTALCLLVVAAEGLRLDLFNYLGAVLGLFAAGNLFMKDAT